MGTRHLTCVVLDGEYRVAQYGQCDGYPDGQGAVIIKFLREEYLPGLFRAKVDATKVVDADEYRRRWNALNLSKGDKFGFVPYSDAQRFAMSYPHLNRDMGAGILAWVQSAKAPEVTLSVQFAADGLFCEWAYVLDLDHDMLEIYQGFGKTPPPPGERFADFQLETYGADVGQYYPVRLVDKKPIDWIRSEDEFDVQGWLSDLGRIADEEEDE